MHRAAIWNGEAGGERKEGKERGNRAFQLHEINLIHIFLLAVRSCAAHSAVTASLYFLVCTLRSLFRLLRDIHGTLLLDILHQQNCNFHRAGIILLIAQTRDTRHSVPRQIRKFSPCGCWSLQYISTVYRSPGESD